MNRRKIELLAPAANAEVAIEAIKHGADAVYIGASSHGARKAAANTLEDIVKVVDFAHQFRARVYVTVNTIIYDSEIEAVEKLCHDLYGIGVDALIVQDMAMLRMNLPPIALHASTQCDIRTPEKARFLQDVGMSQLVLARELTIKEIKSISDAVEIPLEGFVHGALCVSYSGRCHMSFATTGRSANRGECSQLCRLPYTLRDAEGKVIAKDKYLLSLKDLNASRKLEEMMEAGLSSFKIEGRLKDKGYVKNVVTYYSRLLNDIIKANPEKYERSSYGNCEISFEGLPEKSFNRGFTDYFLSSRRPEGIASLLTPKSLGEEIKDIRLLHNGDGISYFDQSGNYQGVNVNKIENGKIVPGRKVDIPSKAVIRRTYDLEWQKRMEKDTARRTIGIFIEIDSTGVTVQDERGVAIRLPLDVTMEEARMEMDYEKDFAKLGNTVYKLEGYKSNLPKATFIPRSEITALRRKITDALDRVNRTVYPFEYRRQESSEAKFPYKKLDFRDNVANSLAKEFYLDHGASSIAPALELGGSEAKKGSVVMTTRHCILREIGLCKRLKGRHIPEPLTLSSGNNRYRLHFNCADCEMEVLL